VEFHNGIGFALNPLHENWLRSYSSPPLGETSEREQAVESAFLNSLLGRATHLVGQ
jgi:hypothetical protein